MQEARLEIVQAKTQVYDKDVQKQINSKSCFLGLKEIYVQAMKRVWSYEHEEGFQRYTPWCNKKDYLQI